MILYPNPWEICVKYDLSKLKWVNKGWQPTPTFQESSTMLWRDEEILYDSLKQTLVPIC
jgi:hypothetical protein